MSLSSEDSLRLNVLLTQELQAIRIDESRMMVHALTGRGEAQVPLASNCRDELYLRKVRELFSTHALGSPGGYPVFLKRWTRMGQVREQNLDKLLLLGEPEAVVAVAHAPGLSEALAQCAWWAMPTADIARRLLHSEAVARSSLGQELAAYLLEYMPFESEPQAIIENVRLVLLPNLVDEETRQDLWDKATRKTIYYVGFLQTMPDTMPDTSTGGTQANPALEKIQRSVTPLLATGNPYAKQLCRLLSTPGQIWLATLDKAISKLVNQDMTVASVHAIANYFAAISSDEQRQSRDMNEIEAQVQQRTSFVTGDSKADEHLQQLCEQLPDNAPEISAMLALAMVGEELINPVFAQTDAMGSVMRRKLAPVTEPLLGQIRVLLA